LVPSRRRTWFLHNDLGRYLYYLVPVNNRDGFSKYYGTVFILGIVSMADSAVFGWAARKPVITLQQIKRP
jgi:hypothetical protein